MAVVLPAHTAKRDIDLGALNMQIIKEVDILSL